MITWPTYTDVHCRQQLSPQRERDIRCWTRLRLPPPLVLISPAPTPPLPTPSFARNPITALNTCWVATGRSVCWAINLHLIVFYISSIILRLGPFLHAIFTTKWTPFESSWTLLWASLTRLKSSRTFSELKLVCFRLNWKLSNTVRITLFKENLLQGSLKFLSHLRNNWIHCLKFYNNLALRDGKAATVPKVRIEPCTRRDLRDSYLIDFVNAAYLNVGTWVFLWLILFYRLRLCYSTQTDISIYDLNEHLSDLVEYIVRSL